jgi:hypothetical protein
MKDDVWRNHGLSSPVLRDGRLPSSVPNAKLALAAIS